MGQINLDPEAAGVIYFSAPPSVEYPSDISLPSSQYGTISLSKPAYKTPTAIPTLETQIVRISDKTAFGITNEDNARNRYSKRQAWNCDESMIYLTELSGAFGSDFIVDAVSYDFIRAIDPLFNEHWHPTDPDLMYFVRVSTEAQLCTYNVLTDAITVIHTFTGYDLISIGNAEGNFSNDYRYVVFVLRPTGGGTVRHIVSFDMQTLSIIDTLVESTSTSGDATVSPNGNYVVVTAVSSGNLYHDVYDRDTMTFQRRLDSHTNSGYSNTSHICLAVDGNGDDCMVMMFAPNGWGHTRLTKFRLSDGERTQLHGFESGDDPDTSYNSNNSIGTYYHVSGIANDRPGWIYLSASIYDTTRNAVMSREVYSLKLDGSEIINRFAQTWHSNGTSEEKYFRDAMCAPNRDGSKILFGTDWEDASGSAFSSAYVVGINV